MTRRPIPKKSPSGPKAAPSKRAILPQGDAGDAEGIVAEGVQRKIGEYLETAESIVGTLKEDLIAYRERNRVLVQERNELMKRLLTVESLNLDATTADEERLRLKADRDLLQKELSEFRREIEQLYNRYGMMEAALAEEREKNVQAQEEIACLEAQIKQLNTIVDLMSIKLELSGGSPKLES